MKPQHLLSVITASSAILTTFIPKMPALAQGVQFVCASNEGVPMTVARHPRYGEIPVIRWVSQHFSTSGYTPQQRCEMVSARFRNYYREGTLNYLTTGRINRQPVICVAQSQNRGCAKLLFTLKPQSNPTLTLQRLMNVRAQAGGPLNETRGRLYIDLDQYLEEQATVEKPANHQISPPNSQQEVNQQNLW